MHFYVDFTSVFSVLHQNSGLWDQSSTHIETSKLICVVNIYGLYFGRGFALKLVEMMKVSVATKVYSESS